MKYFIVILFCCFASLNSWAGITYFDKLSTIKDPQIREQCKLNWDDNCQDKVMEYFYGKRWLEFKQVLLEYIKDADADNVDKVLKLMALPVHLIGEVSFQGNKNLLHVEGNYDDFEKMKLFLKLAVEYNHPKELLYKDIEFLLIKGRKYNPLIQLKGEYGIRFYSKPSKRDPGKYYILPKIKVIITHIAGEPVNLDRLSVIKDFEMQKTCKLNWSDACQDKVVEHFYGSKWQEFKEVIIKFQEAIGKKDISTTFKLCTMPLVFKQIAGLVGNYYLFREVYSVENYKKFESAYSYWVLHERFEYGDEASKTLYKNINFYFNKEGDNINYKIPIIKFTDAYGIRFSFDNTEAKESSDPLIAEIYLF